ncbi:putative methionine aminopeptidase [Dioszegia hungarica]|uniref:Methionine aminopeptidase n=1 Tax=Dioszegia hungarica TaxID=4972 RepID=A0AA38LW04_9TREE|nr:putative methionine aminopeptidase [Dioszegia hungarica]KAI9637890.1 putative methionine aminopeptidase [Dioszegia hungarica]
MTICAGCGEKEASRLECPNCKKLGIPGSFFCDQDCFKRTWGTHKLIHNIVQMAAKAETDKNSSIPTNMRDYKFTGPLRPHYPLSAKRTVPAHIKRPDYADDPQGQSPIEMARERAVKTLNAEEIEGMRKVCRLSREVLDILASHVRPGITTDELDRICHEECIKRDAYPSPLNYGKFPKSVCTSVNEVICHGIPDQRELVEGDIINLDVSLFHGGFHGDLNATYPVGKVDEESMDLMATTKKSMEDAIAICKPGVAYREIGNKIEEVVKPKGYSIVRRYTGHGIHYMFHCQPNVVHYGNSKMPGRMEAGQIFTIEPMINLGTANLDHWKDDWTAVTMDGRRITETGCEILTRPPPASSASKKRKKKKSKAAAVGEADVEEDGGSGAATPIGDAAVGVEGLEVTGNGQ